MIKYLLLKEMSFSPFIRIILSYLDFKFQPTVYKCLPYHTIPKQPNNFKYSLKTIPSPNRTGWATPTNRWSAFRGKVAAKGRPPESSCGANRSSSPCRPEKRFVRRCFFWWFLWHHEVGRNVGYLEWG